MSSSSGQQQLDYISKLKAKHLAAAGIMPCCTDPITKQIYFLMGANSQHKLCYFHGNNDYAREEPHASTMNYNDASILTSAREFAEESNSVVGTEAMATAALKSDKHNIMFYPLLSTNVRGYIVYLGHMGTLARKAVCERFLKLAKNPELTPCEREMSYMVWINAADLYKGVEAHYVKKSKDSIVVTCDTLFTAPKQQQQQQQQQHHAPVQYQMQQTQLSLRSWLSGWFHTFLMEDCKDKGVTLFKQMCIENANFTMPIESIYNL